jgi:tetratricopeptide (TPR) repeat protein
MTQAFKDPAAAKAAGDAIKEAAKAQADAVKDINSKFFDKAVAQLEKAMGKMTSQLTEQLNKQKDDALKAFDDQIAGIEALAEAEERLTATEEYESNKRQRIRDRELQRNNYQKERALAIYEGRIDDARNLDLEELKNTDDYNKEISDMDKARQKELHGQNRQDAIAIIRNQRDEASRLFDEAIKEFEDYIEEQLRNGTTSETEFREQFERIAARAQTTSTGLTTSFRNFFTALPEAQVFSQRGLTLLFKLQEPNLA